VAAVSAPPVDVFDQIKGLYPDLAPYLVRRDDAAPAPPAAYQTSHIKSRRRTKAEMAEIRAGIYQIVEADQPMTVRQVFYRAEVAGLVEKTEAEYTSTVARLLLEMRRAGELPYDWISDNTRWMRKPKTYTGLADFIDTHQRAYRRSLWSEADTYVEIWLEKEALAGVVIDVTSEYDVPLMVSRGFASEATCTRLPMRSRIVWSRARNGRSSSISAITIRVACTSARASRRACVGCATAYAMASSRRCSSLSA
jgi:hypothetical protein